jgi:hypothetical protein
MSFRAKREISKRCAGHGAIAEAVKVRRIGRKDDANKARASAEMLGLEEA